MTFKKQLVAKYTRDCKYFNGIQHETCSAGVNMRQLVGGEDLGWALRIPCLKITRNHSAGSLPEKEIPKVECSKFCTLTIEEAGKQADDDLAAHERHMKAITDAHADAKSKGFKKGSGGTGSVKCPCCADGRIQYSVASYNGHMHAVCTSANCVRWME